MKTKSCLGPTRYILAHHFCCRKSCANFAVPEILDVVFSKAKRQIFLIGFTVLGLISGCALMPIQNPTLSHIKGVWESTTYGYYSTLKIESENDGLLLMVQEQDNVNAYKLISLSPETKGIAMLFKGIENDEKAFAIIATVAKDSLTITDKSKPDMVFSYIRSDKFLKSREIANRYMSAYKYNEHNK